MHDSLTWKAFSGVAYFKQVQDIVCQNMSNIFCKRHKILRFRLHDGPKPWISIFCWMNGFFSLVFLYVLFDFPAIKVQSPWFLPIPFVFAQILRWSDLVWSDPLKLPSLKLWCVNCPLVLFSQRTGGSFFFGGHGKSVAKVFFLAKNVRSWKELWSVTISKMYEDVMSCCFQLEACKLQEPGGKCAGVPTGAGDCTMATPRLSKEVVKQKTHPQTRLQRGGKVES